MLRMLLVQGGVCDSAVLLSNVTSLHNFLILPLEFFFAFWARLTINIRKWYPKFLPWSRIALCKITLFLLQHIFVLWFKITDIWATQANFRLRTVDMTRVFVLHFWTTLKVRSLNVERLIVLYIVNIDPLNTKRRLLYLKTQFVPRSKHFSSRLQKPISLCCKWHKSLFVLR